MVSPGPEFFKSLGRLTFEFAALEHMVGLCILELDPSQDHVKIWKKSFESKLETLSADVQHSLAQIASSSDVTLLNAAIDEATVLGRRRNTLIHGVLHIYGGELVLLNRAHQTTYSVEPSAIDELREEASELRKRFVTVRGDCIGIRWTRERSRSSEVHPS